MGKRKGELNDLRIRDMIGIIQGIEAGLLKSNIMRKMDCSMTLVYSTIDKMEEKGYILQEAKKGNKRSKLLSVTKKGKELYKLIV